MIAKEINISYQRMMVKTRLLSMIPIFWPIVTIGVEQVWLLRAIIYNWSVIGPDLALRSFLQLGLGTMIVGVLVVRFVTFLFRSENNYRLCQLSWLVAAVSFVLYLYYFANWFAAPLRFGVYDIARADPIIYQGPIFIVFSGVRFVLTFLIAWRKER